MRQQIKLKLIIIFIGVITIIIASENILNLQFPHPIRHHSFNRLFENGFNSADVEIVILGDSTEAAALRSTELFNKPTINLAIPGSGYEVWLPIFKANIDKFPNANILIVSIDPMSILRDGIGERHGDYSSIIKFGVSSFSIPRAQIYNKLRNWIVNESPVKNILTGSKFDFKNVEKIVINNKNKTSNKLKKPEFNFKPDQGTAKKKAYVSNFKKNNAIKANKQALESILNLALNHNLQVIFTRTPVTPDFFNTEKDFWEANMQEILLLTKQTLSSEQWTLFNALPNIDFEEEYFDDPNHLNQKGASKFTILLNDFIQNLDKVI